MRLGNRVCGIEDGLLVAVFVVALWLPLVGAGLRWGVLTPEQENRTLAPFPAPPSSLRDLASLPGGLASYLRDNFGFRGTLVRAQAFVRVKLLGVSTSPNVILGKDGWLFYAPEFSAKGDRVVPLFNERQLENWRKVLEARRDWLARQGIKYVFVISPSKQDTYPELLPDDFKRGVETRLEQFLGYMKEHSDVEVLDPRPALAEAKAGRLLFYKTDTHMNIRGSFVAYRFITGELSKSFPSVKPLSESDCDLSSMTVSGDLTKSLGLYGVLTEQIEVLRPRAPAYTGEGSHRSDSQLFPGETFFTKVQDRSLPRLVMFFDSGFGRIPFFVAQHFSHAAFSGFPELDPELVRAERPDVVVQEMSENHLTEEPPLDAPEIRSLRFSDNAPPAQRAPGGPPPQYDGHQDVTSCEYVFGWAWDASRPDEAVNVAVYDGDNLLAVIPAYNFRRDLLDGHVGDGAHGFLYYLPRVPAGAQPHKIHVRIAGTDFELHNSPAEINCPSR